MLREADERLGRSNRDHVRFERADVPGLEGPKARLRGISDKALLSGRRPATDLDRAEDAEIERELACGDPMD